VENLAKTVEKNENKMRTKIKIKINGKS